MVGAEVPAPAIPIGLPFPNGYVTEAFPSLVTVCDTLSFPQRITLAGVTAELRQ
jgi:hypothetical protein